MVKFSLLIGMEDIRSWPYLNDCITNESSKLYYRVNDNAALWHSGSRRLRSRHGWPSVAMGIRWTTFQSMMNAKLNKVWFWKD